MDARDDLCGAADVRWWGMQSLGNEIEGAFLADGLDSYRVLDGDSA